MALLTGSTPTPSPPQRLRALLEHTWAVVAHVAGATVDGFRHLVDWYAADRRRLRTTLTGLAVLLVLAVLLGLGIGLALTTATEALVGTVEGMLVP